jgi:hypothetical protein
MGYCADSDVIGEFKSLTVTATSVVTTAKLAEWIAQASAEIDGRLSTKYVVPITGTNSLSIMKNICTWLVADRASKVMELQATAPIQSDVKVIKVGTGTAKDARCMLEDIMENRLVLVDATLKSTSGGIQSRNVSCNQRHQFKRNRDQW